MTALLPLAAAWQILTISLAAPIMGSVLLLAIARLTGAGWDVLRVPARWAVLLPAVALLGIAQLASPPPPHLETWLAWWAVALRGLVAGGAFAFAASRLLHGGGETLAGVTLALYAALVTPIASDWMLGQAPGHPVSAVGMMMFVESIGTAAALPLALGLGDLPFRRDMAKLGVAAALGLAYLAYMDFLIVWFGNVPARVGFYLERGTPAMSLLASGALLVGLAAPIASLSLVGGERGQRIAGVTLLAGAVLFNIWWVAGGLLGSLLGLALVAAVAVLAQRRAVAHG